MIEILMTVRYTDMVRTKKERRTCTGNLTFSCLYFLQLIFLYTFIHFVSDILELDPRSQGQKMIEIIMVVRYTDTVRSKKERLTCTGN